MILKKIKNWLNKPYYFYSTIEEKLFISVILGILVFLFLYIFRPFTVDNFEVYILEYTLGIAFFSAIFFFLILFLFPLIFPKLFNEDKWTIGKNINLSIVCMFLIGSILWYLSYKYIETKSLTHINYYRFLVYTFLVNIFNIFIIIYIKEKTIRVKREKNAQNINSFKSNLQNANKNLDINIIIYSDNKQEQLNFNLKDLVYISSQGNYASFFLKENTNSNLKEKILRITLVKIEKYLEQYPNVFRCHKSYIVNSKFISSIEGNARGYLLKSNIISFDIPVSRKFTKKSLQKILE